MGNRQSSSGNERGESERGRAKGDDALLFKDQLKVKYEQWFKAIQPIPYLRDKNYSVDKIFVDGGIEFFVDSWVLLQSYQFLFQEPLVKSKRRFVIGEPGYGKSTLALQFAHDWCKSVQGSYLKDVEVLLLLRLRQLRGVTSIYTAIKKYIVPDSPLNDKDIESILRSSSSVVMILDGFDEYPDEERYPLSDIMKIIKNDMFGQFQVILTTRYLPKQYSSNTKLLRLTGFNFAARTEYIQKVIAPSSIHTANRIKKQLEENPVLRDLCGVPLIFVMFAHMSHENKGFEKLETVTDFFRCVIECLHSHMRKKMEDENVRKSYLHEDYHEKLDEVAFNGLRKPTRQIIWKRRSLRQRLGQEFYDLYLQIGVLVEEESPGDKKSLFKQDDREVRFFHKLFCEWYAAHHLAKIVITQSYENVIKDLQDMNPSDLQYVYRFACGLSKNAALQIIKYMEGITGGNKFAMLCILEQPSLSEHILETVKELCKKQINIDKGDNKLLQRSTVQLLEMASMRKIHISSVRFSECNCRFDLSDKYYIWIESNLPLPVLKTLTTLKIYDTGRDIAGKEITCILEYAAECTSIKEVWLVKCLLPQKIKVKSSRTLFVKRTEVWWAPRGGFADYLLNVFTGLWKVFRTSGDSQRGTDIATISTERFRRKTDSSEVRRKTDSPEVHRKDDFLRSRWKSDNTQLYKMSCESLSDDDISKHPTERNAHYSTMVMTDEVYQKVAEKIASYRTQRTFPEEYVSDTEDD